MKTVGFATLALIVLALTTASATASPLPAACSGPACVAGASVPDVTPLDDAQVLAFLAGLQDTPGATLVPLFAGSDDTTTYSNAVAAAAFLSAGQPARARRALDGFPAAGDPCPACACRGAYQQFRLASTGGPRPAMDPNDFWIGDNAWLLAAMKQYRTLTGDSRYNGRITMLTSWLTCLEALTPDPGIYSGFRRNGALMAWLHPEGSLDVYGALKGLGAEPVRASVKRWLDDAVWPPDQRGCYDIGWMNRGNLPTDNVSWGYLALGSDYQCLLQHAEARTARTQDRYLVEAFDRFAAGAWITATMTTNPSIQVDLAQEQAGSAHTLRVHYAWNDQDAWFLLYRTRDVDLAVTPAFRYYFWIKGDGSGNRLEVKLSNVSGETFWYHFPLDFRDWRVVSVRYDQFEPFGPGGAPLAEIGKIEFAVNNTSRTATAGRDFFVGPVWYQDRGAAALWPVDGFDAFEAEQNWLFVEGTGQMAAAYCLAGETGRYQHAMDELTGILQPAGNGLGLPNFLTGGINRPVAEAVASSWYVLAARCVNPFDPQRSAYLPAVWARQ
jgi:hypothetical protein